MAATYAQRAVGRPLDVTPLPLPPARPSRVPVRADPTDITRTRAPPQFYDLVLRQFRSAQNLNYLENTFHQQLGNQTRRPDLGDALQQWASTYGVGVTMVESDPAAQRSRIAGSLDLWAEVRRLNEAFLRQQLQARTPYAWPNAAPRDGQAQDDEGFAYRMFEADSLRPPGMEFLNPPGPLWGIQEEQYTRAGMAPIGRAPIGRAPIAPGRSTGVDHMTAGGLSSYSADVLDHSAHLMAESDMPWSQANPNRTPEQALAEYWGADRVSSTTMLGAANVPGALDLDIYGRGPDWQQNGGTRFMRYPDIPFWQCPKREGTDREINETLGMQMREDGAHVRAWDMSRLRADNATFRENLPGHTSTYML